MTKSGFINFGNLDLDLPDVRIIQYSYLTMRESWNNPNRNAPFWRFYWNATPGAELIFREKRIELRPESVVLIAPHVNYSSFSNCQFTQLYMHFEWKMGLAPSDIFVFSAAPMMKLLGDAEKWFGIGEEKFVVRMHSILFYYLTELLAGEQSWGTRPRDKRIERAVELMNSELHLNNREIAQMVNMSCDNFQRVFRECMGTTACRYRLSRRMELAQQLLQNPELKLDDIAFQTGFANRYQFSKAFKQFFKISPGNSRKTPLPKQ